MKKVFQTVVDPGKGNCMQAVVASLFEKELEEVPNFIEEGREWWECMQNVYKENGYIGIMCFNPKGRLDVAKQALKHDRGINGYWAATVPSQTFPDVMHAVVIDENLNIVHDPNPNQRALDLGPEDIVDIDVVKRDWYIDVDGTFKLE